MSFGYTYIDGCRVEVNVAQAFYKLRDAFRARWGLDLLVSDGTRTRAEQEYLWNGWINHLPGFNLAAAPGESNHEEDGPIGPRALDVHDSGDDAGVTSIGSARSIWLRDNCPAYGFINTGYNFRPQEGWHIEYQGDLGGSGNSSFDQTVQNEQAWLISRGYDLGPTGADGIAGPMYEAAVKAYQTFLRAYGYTGDADGIWGAGTQAAHAKFYNEVQNGSTGQLVVDGAWGTMTTKALQARLGVTADGEIGPATTRALQTALGGITVDGDWGAATTSALQRFLGVNADGEIGSITTRALQAFLNTGKPFTAAPAEPTKPTDPDPTAAPARPNDDPAVPGLWLGKWSANREKRTGHVGYFVIHHGADPRPVDVQISRFMSPNDRQVSPTWFIGADGIARKIVHPDDRQWTTGKIIDQQAVTVETQNTSGAPEWGISKESMDAIAQLVAWASKRFGFPIDRAHVLGHNEARTKLDNTIGATACPGPSMDLDYIVKKAQELANPVQPEVPGATDHEMLMNIATTLEEAAVELKKIAS